MNKIYTMIIIMNKKKKSNKIYKKINKINKNFNKRKIKPIFCL